MVLAFATVVTLVVLRVRCRSTKYLPRDPPPRHSELGTQADIPGRSPSDGQELSRFWRDVGSMDGRALTSTMGSADNGMSKFIRGESIEEGGFQILEDRRGSMTVKLNPLHQTARNG